jgi:pimeloyl-ACP methyl ester carboxylesterase
VNTVSEHVKFDNDSGLRLSGRIDRPVDKPRGWALFAHCFTCTKNLLAANHMSRTLAQAGIGVLRFDFTGLGNSEGEFAATTFSHNVDDLVAAARYLEATHGSPRLLVGHSLGGTAALHAAARLDGVRAVATVAAPAHAAHVAGLLRSSLAEIEATGEAEVDLGGRVFRIRREFLEDLRRQATLDLVRQLRCALLVLHSPIDVTVDVANAADIFAAARHPKSFVSLDRADHLLTAERDAVYAGQVIAIWAGRYMQGDSPPVHPW